MNDIIRTLQFEKEQLEAKIRLLENKLESDNRQISEYDHELRQAKRLLKAAVEDIVWLNEHTVDGEGQCLIETATDMETCLACPLNVNNPHVCGWKHQVEALALIGNDIDVPATEGDTNVGHKQED